MNKPHRLTNRTLKLMMVLHWSKHPCISRPGPYLVQVPSSYLYDVLGVSKAFRKDTIESLKSMGLILEYQELLDNSYMFKLLPPLTDQSNSPRSGSEVTFVEETHE